MEPHENGTPFPLQRILIGAGTLIVIVLTVAAAVFLAVQQQPSPPVPPTFTPSATPPVVGQAPTVTLTPTIPPPASTDTPTPTATPPSPTETPTEIPPTATNTPLPPPPPSDTPTQVVIVVTATPRLDTPTPDPCAPPAGWVQYVVQPGDTLAALARQTNTGLLDLQQINCLSSSVLQPGQIIYLPFTPPVPTVTNTTTPTPFPTSTRRSTPTPIAPIINEVIARESDTGQPDNDKLITVVVRGNNFEPRQAGFSAVLLGPTQIALVVDRSGSSTSFQATRVVSDTVVMGLDEGVYDLVVTNPDGRSDIETRVFPPGAPTPTPPPPSISNVVAFGGDINQPQNIRLIITGENFQPTEPDFEVELVLESDASEVVELEVDDSQPVTSAGFEAVIKNFGDLTETGDYNLVIRNPNGQPPASRAKVINITS